MIRQIYRNAETGVLQMTTWEHDFVCILCIILFCKIFKEFYLRQNFFLFQQINKNRVFNIFFGISFMTEDKIN